MSDNVFASRPTRIMVLDDERLILVTLGNGLRAAGFEVQTAESVDEAETLLSSGEHPDLAILDINLPGRSGLEFAQRLGELDHIPFIMLSASSEPKYVEQATRSGALGYRVKPVDIGQLLPDVKAALMRASELQDLRERREQLQEALANERDISVAVGLLMVQLQLPRQAAFESLRQSARQQRRPIGLVALDLIREFELV